MVGREPKGLRIDALSGRWGRFELQPVSLDVTAGQYWVLLGPSGCGKTTLLELICGLRQPASGKVWLDGRDITYADPADRRIGFVPQDYLLFPGRTAEWNLMFPARVRRMGQDERKTRFEAVVDMLQLGPVLPQGVETLSGGERQRVALGRALMAAPDMLLLDEPVAALPENQRDAVCREIRRLQRELGITTIHVSHNLDEALAVADRIVVMNVAAWRRQAPLKRFSTGRQTRSSRNSRRHATSGQRRSRTAYSRAAGSDLDVSIGRTARTVRSFGPSTCVLAKPHQGAGSRRKSSIARARNTAS